MLSSFVNRLVDAFVPSGSMASSADMPSTAPWADYWYQSFGLPSLTGVSGGDDAYEYVAPMMAATQFLSGIGSTIPINMTKTSTSKTGETTSNIVRDDARQLLMNDEMNPDQTSGSARSMGCAWQINRGTAFFEIQRDAARTKDGYQRPLWMWPIYPSRCLPIRDKDTQELWWKVTNNDGSDSFIRESNMFRVPYTLMARNGLLGIGVADRAMATVQLGQSFDRTENDASMSGVPRIAVEFERNMTLPEQDAFRRQWKELYTQSGEQVAVLAGKAKAVPLSWSATASDFVKRRELHRLTCASLYAVPPILLQMLLDPQADPAKLLQMFQKCGLKWLNAWVQEANRKLLSKEERLSGLHWKIDYHSLLEADPVSRADYYSRMFPLATLSPNDILQAEGKNPYPEGNRRFVQGAMRPVDEPYNATSPQNPPQDPKSGKQDPLKLPKQEADTRDVHLKACARAMLEDTVRRLTAKETKAACNAAKKPQEWFTWVDTFYVDHQTWAAGELKLPLQACAAFGVNLTPDEMAKSLVAQSTAAMVSVADGDRESFASRVESLAADWEKHRPSETVRAIVELN